ncbi:LytR/AlgR family response regulator transcription factor [Pedobacter sandarakinus]|uniref:LytR/AlgR family response regulator transcription factor n=1 Tax=Pedobacter sandarakinus TaxID=353156 RepID=UPI0022452232|nr:LytTR family DNA-binding domain-containing protein [Pedobacter sandarakinus]MCX2575225.1 LytTR family DNA-binding domain-containing protein [Pedobacter sandarakinus]
MTKLKAIIVDDEEFARSSLFFLLQQNCPQIEITGIGRSVSEAKDILAHHQIDLIFLDIAMPGGNGFELIPDAQKQNAAVIFTTAYDQYALKAIKANALDYLLKPIDIEELKIAVDKVEQHLKLLQSQNLNDERIHNLATSLTTRTDIRKLTLPHGQGFKMIDVDEIIYIEADSNYSVVHLANEDKITVSKVLREFEELLPSDQFVRVHKSSIINLNHLKEYNSKNGLQVYLKNGESINISRRRASDFFEKIKLFIKPGSDH